VKDPYWQKLSDRKKETLALWYIKNELKQVPQKKTWGEWLDNVLKF
jgi:hypothetical protein